jgi:hypothetical protein
MRVNGEMVKAAWLFRETFINRKGFLEKTLNRVLSSLLGI